MARPVNPYVTGNPVGNSPAFVGRADVLREVLRVLRRPQDNAIVLYGQRRIGKTSILQHLAAVLPQEGPYRAVYLDLQYKAAWPLGRVLQELARTIAHALGQPDPDLGSDPETAFRQEWLPAVLGDLPEGCSLVLLFDECDVLADPKREQPAVLLFSGLRDLVNSDPRRLQFVFVIGRNVGDLDSIAFSLFKDIPVQRISLLTKNDITDLVRLSEKDNTLLWPDGTVERVWQLTSGHPFLTQQLCWDVWERACDQEPGETPTVAPQDVDAAVPNILEASRNMLQSLWDGLPTAERLTASALAEAGPAPSTQEELEHLLHESGARVAIRELQNAPHLLQEWDLIEPANGGYRFRVELLRCWVAERKPLRRVQEELDRIGPVAESCYQAALGLYRNGQLDQAASYLKQAIDLNPYHVRANQLLAQILLDQGQLDEAGQLLEWLYDYQPAAARRLLVEALLAQAQAAENNSDEQLLLYERALKLDPMRSEAAAGKRRIWEQRGDAFLGCDDLEAAVEAYRMADLGWKVLEVLEQAERYQDAMDQARKLARECPEMRDWPSELERLKRKTYQAELYQRALGALQSGDRQTAQNLLVELVGLDPGYRQTTQYLHLTVTGEDIPQLQRKIDSRWVINLAAAWAIGVFCTLLIGQLGRGLLASLDYTRLVLSIGFLLLACVSLPYLILLSVVQRGITIQWNRPQSWFPRLISLLVIMVGLVGLAITLNWPSPPSISRFIIEEPQRLDADAEHALIRGRLEYSGRVPLTEMQIVVYVIGVGPKQEETWRRSKVSCATFAERQWTLLAECTTFPKEYSEFSLKAILVRSDKAADLPSELVAKGGGDELTSILSKYAYLCDVYTPCNSISSAFQMTRTAVETATQTSLPTPSHMPTFTPTLTPTRTRSASSPAVSPIPTTTPPTYVPPTATPTSVPTIFPTQPRPPTDTPPRPPTDTPPRPPTDTPPRPPTDTPPRPPTDTPPPSL